jgi:hypothetical protein
MARRPPPIARIRLARSWARVLALPIALLVAGGTAAVAALMLLPPPLAYVGAAAAALPVVAAIVIAVRLGTMRLDVEEAAVRLRWLGGSRTYALVPGPVTRVRLLGEQASSLRSRTGVLGWQVGRARLRGDEDVEVVRLARTRTAILVPTDRGRLAVAAASEPELLDALSRAARARKRLEDLVARERDDPEAEAGGSARSGTGDAREGPPALAIETPPHILTGIERAMLDERLARERLEAESAARAEAEARARAAADAAWPDAVPAAMATPPPTSAPPETAPAVPIPSRRRLPSVGLVLLPVLVTLVLWGAALALDRLPAPATEPGRLTALALVLAGPATSIGAIMARAWWPRLVGVVVTSGLAAAAFVARSLFGA